jgi:hypothetical protein
MATGKGPAADNEIPSSCAYNFPAVVLTVGKDGWHHLDEVPWPCVRVCVYVCVSKYTHKIVVCVCVCVCTYISSYHKRCFDMSVCMCTYTYAHVHGLAMVKLLEVTDELACCRRIMNLLRTSSGRYAPAFA